MPIRPALVTDWPGISRLLTQLEYPGTETFLAAKLTAAAGNPAMATLVWTETPPTTPTVLGFLSLQLFIQFGLEADIARVTFFAVDENARSKGIGRELEEAATNIAQQWGCAAIEVHCHSRRTRAHDFYRRQGYEESPKYLIKRLK
jgi:GNAT superfamily N-acetyltransferase